MGIGYNRLDIDEEDDVYLVSTAKLICKIYKANLKVVIVMPRMVVL